MQIGFELSLSASHDAAIQRVTDALQAEGFGVLTTIDVRNTLQEKLGEDFRPYTILGACNPQLAHLALSTDPNVGLMLPCNVTVEATDNGSLVRFVNPDAMLAMFQDSGPEIQQVATDASERLQRVRTALAK